MERIDTLKTKQMDIKEKIKTFEDAMAATGRTQLPDFSSFPSDMRKHFEALFKMYIIVEALNEGWTSDWDNRDELKYYPWFYMSPSSFAFDDSYYGCESAAAGSGSRLKLRTSGLSQYCAVQFQDIWENIQLG